MHHKIPPLVRCIQRSFCLPSYGPPSRIQPGSLRLGQALPRTAATLNDSCLRSGTSNSRRDIAYTCLNASNPDTALSCLSSCSSQRPVGEISARALQRLDSIASNSMRREPTMQLYACSFNAR
ncbi:unnamed protein product [Peniophora sp. CBMAI 1063]|nr:unnamed protein product [Peniophora sp. CBMAI 1063]